VRALGRTASGAVVAAIVVPDGSRTALSHEKELA
jgi:hypothetical protein